jgi:hypothetical protein
MFVHIYESPWFWPAVVLYIVFWVLVAGFWQGRKEESRNINTFVEKEYLMHKYPFDSDFGYNVMSFLGPPVFLIYILLLVVLGVGFLIKQFLILILVLGYLIYSLGYKVGSK